MTIGMLSIASAVALPLERGLLEGRFQAGWDSGRVLERIISGTCVWEP